MASSTAISTLSLVLVHGKSMRDRQLSGKFVREVAVNCDLQGHGRHGKTLRSNEDPPGAR